jgi:hypothetical protein
MIKKITRNKLFLPFLEVFYIFVIVYSGFFAPTPNVIAPLGIFLGIIYFFMVFSAIGEFSLKADIYLFLGAILGSSLGTGIIFGGCQFTSNQVCSPNMLSAQIFGNYAFPLLLILVLWITIRVPLFFRKK